MTRRGCDQERYSAVAVVKGQRRWPGEQTSGTLPGGVRTRVGSVRVCVLLVCEHASAVCQHLRQAPIGHQPWASPNQPWASQGRAQRAAGRRSLASVPSRQGAGLALAQQGVHVVM